MRTNIFAHTSFAASSYVSVNEEDDGRVTVAVRSEGAQVPSCAELPRAELEALAANLAAYLVRTTPAPADIAPKGKK